MIELIKNTWADFWGFVKNPKDQEDSNRKFGFKSKRLFSILIIDIPIMAMLIAIIYGVEQTGLIDTQNHKSNQLLQQSPPWRILLFGVIIVPFIEEIFFRLHLRLKQNYPVKLLILISSITGEKNKERLQILIEYKWSKYYKYIFYLSALVFAVIHILNFEYSTMLLVFIPILVMPQFVIGLFSGYLRVKYGFIWGFYLHLLHNLIFISIPLVFMAGPVKKVNTTNDQYKLIIEEVGIGISHSKSSSSIGSDSISFENIRFKPLLANLLDKEVKLIEFNPKEKSNQRINLTFKKYSKNLLSKQVILDEMQEAYNFSITKNEILQEAWTLQISDTILLLQHKLDSSNTSSVTISETNIKLKNIDLAQLIKSLNSNYKEHFILNTDLSDNFNFDFKKGNFDDLKNTLKNDYGLILKKTNSKIERINIIFKANKNGT